MIEKNSTNSIQRPKFNGFTDYYKKRLFSFLKLNLPHLTTSEARMINKAYLTAYKAHLGVQRQGGDHEAYISHPVEVAVIIAKEMGFGPTSIAAALLHDVVEDNINYTHETISKSFNQEIALIVAGVTKITDHGDERKAGVDIENTSSQKKYFKNMLTLIPDDFRVLLIKAADRLHNMRTMDDMPENSQKIKSSENLYIYSRLAGMAGLWNIKSELEDLSFKYLYPLEYNQLVEIKEKNIEKIKKKNQDFQKKLQQLLISDYDFEISTTKRSLYSVWNKIKKYRKEFINVHNYTSTRIIIDVNSKCKNKEIKVKRKIAYDLYLQITSDYYEKDNSLRDWIIHPKQNGFSALVFDVMYNGEWQEIQIMSKKDSIIADRGWINKENAPGLVNLQKQIREDLSEIINTLDGGESTGMLHLFTPKGDIIELPKGSTILDFAFKIHTNLGLKCLGGVIDGQDMKVKRNYILQNTQVVKIIIDENITPKANWLDFVITSRARTSLKNYFKKEETIIYNTKDSKDIQNHYINRKKPFELNSSINFKLAKCCRPVYGDKAMVYKRIDNQLIIHHENCQKALTYRANDSENTTTVLWGKFEGVQTYITEIEVEGTDRIGMLKDIINAITITLEKNINKIKVENQEGFFKGHLEIYVKESKEIKEIIDNLLDIRGMISVIRKFN
ncbi:MAG: bifunctional (p)ppGpp synthetase/guanosine-3',5'-bis(diphosphate) 3'-pyrophosphohydrolase [Bacteroidales bacterium]|nr:bifunctional (p)ppGpp synthetase/guanosine-3',5'-bis(diphosphate) 3'-pyrophosphohydrolase [Bacteroidales bacterium]